MNLFDQTNDKQFTGAIFVLLGMVAVIATVQGFQHIGGYIPCKLCFAQREPFYVAIPLAALAVLSAWRIWPACLTRGLLLVIALLMLYSVVLGIHHAGVEWKWWEGPGDCGAIEGGITNSAENLLTQMTQTVGPSCNEAAGRFLGLSFAGWNAIVSFVLMIVAIKAAIHSEET